ncbi:MAG TPA: hypothetical protein VM925_27185 [Labilithrix sp.]|nr:hypothetical protein [Labilithrix sp.]
MRYRAGRERGHVEYWSFKANEPGGHRAVWIRLGIFSRPPLPSVAEAWAVAFDRRRGHVAVKSTVPFDTARFSRDAVDLEVAGCAPSLDRSSGALASGRGSLTWDLSIGPARALPIVHFPSSAMYRDGVPPPSKLVTPLSDARAAGVMRVDRGSRNADTWEISGWPAMVGHQWGTGHPELYAWTHCNAWQSSDAASQANGALLDGLVFEALSARVRLGPLLSPMATSAFVRWRGQSWDLSRLRALTKNRGSVSLRRWEMTGEDAGLSVACEVAAANDEIVGLHYPNPAGAITNCLSTKLARARLELRLPDGETVRATSHAAALEIGTVLPGHGIEMYL